MGRDRAAPSRKPDSGHIGTVSTTVRVRRTSRNAMKPRFQCVLAHWKPGFRASGSGPIFMISGQLSGIALELLERGIQVV